VTGQLGRPFRGLSLGFEGDTRIPREHRVRRLRVLALGHRLGTAVSIFRTDFPALPAHIKKRARLELNPYAPQ
jgi:hypothetical protein